MSIESILLLRQQAGIDALRGWLLIILSSMILWTAIIFARQNKEIAKEQQKKRKQLADQFTLTARLAKENQRQPGAWRPQGAGAKNERGAW